MGAACGRSGDTDAGLQERVKKLERASGQHYGHAFPVFVEYAIAQGWQKDADPLHDRVQKAANWLLQWGARDGTRAERPTCWRLSW